MDATITIIDSSKDSQNQNRVTVNTGAKLPVVRSVATGSKAVDLTYRVNEDGVVVIGV